MTKDGSRHSGDRKTLMGLATAEGAVLRLSARWTASSTRSSSLPTSSARKGRPPSHSALGPHRRRPSGRQDDVGRPSRNCACWRTADEGGRRIARWCRATRRAASGTACPAEGRQIPRPIGRGAGAGVVSEERVRRHLLITTQLPLEGQIQRATGERVAHLVETAPWKTNVMRVVLGAGDDARPFLQGQGDEIAESSLRSGRSSMASVNRCEPRRRPVCRNAVASSCQFALSKSAARK